jgi:hypothetical protein
MKKTSQTPRERIEGIAKKNARQDIRIPKIHGMTNP